MSGNAGGAPRPPGVGEVGKGGGPPRPRGEGVLVETVGPPTLAGVGDLGKGGGPPRPRGEDVGVSGKVTGLSRLVHRGGVRNNSLSGAVGVSESTCS